MAFQLDDLLRDDKKDANLIPDLSKATCNSYEEFRRLKENCPEFKIKPEKVRDHFNNNCKFVIHENYVLPNRTSITLYLY